MNLSSHMHPTRMDSGMRIVISGVHSGAGKTTITAGLIAALRSHGLVVQPFKVGPDYIDPTYHSLAAGRPCHNLDSWMMPPDKLVPLFHHHIQTADIAIIEGVMGLFDGQNYQEDSGSTAQVAKLTNSPVFLVIDAGKMARSAAAVALGFQRFDPQLHVAGFIVNNVAGESHGRGVASAIEETTGQPVLGCLPHHPALEIPERHLGLVPTAEAGRWQDFIENAAGHVSRYIDLDRLLSIARPPGDAAPPPHTLDPVSELRAAWQPTQPSGEPLIAVARDEAFNFIYEENLDLLRAAGARIAFFSPLNDTALPSETCGVILSGGFPELYAAKLSANAGMRVALQAAHERGLPIYAECGGLMSLTQSIVDSDGREHPLFGILPGRSLMKPALTMGYRLAQAAGDTWLMEHGEEVRGHEFHHSVWEARPAGLPYAYRLRPGGGSNETVPEGACLESLWASYIHLSFWTRPELALRLVSCARQKM